MKLFEDVYMLKQFALILLLADWNANILISMHFWQREGNDHDLH